MFCNIAPRVALLLSSSPLAVHKTFLHEVVVFF